MIVLLLERRKNEEAGEREGEYCVFHLLLALYYEHRKEIW